MRSSVSPAPPGPYVGVSDGGGHGVPAEGRDERYPVCHGQCGGSLPCNKVLVLRGSCVGPPLHPPGAALAFPRSRTTLLLPCSVLSPSSRRCPTPRRCCSPTPCPCPTPAMGQRLPGPACAAVTRACASLSIYSCRAAPAHSLCRGSGGLAALGGSGRQGLGILFPRQDPGSGEGAAGKGAEMQWPEPSSPALA